MGEYVVILMEKVVAGVESEGGRWNWAQKMEQALLVECPQNQIE